MNKIGIYYGYWCKDWVVNFSKYAYKAEELGFDIIQYDLNAILSASDKNRENLKETIQEIDIEISFCMGLPQQYDISSADSKVRARGIEFLKNAVKVADEFGSDFLGGLIYGPWGANLPPGSENKSSYLNRSIESMKEVVEVAEKYGVYLGLEAVNRFEQFMINTAREALHFAEQIDSKFAGILLDTFHMNMEEIDFTKAIKVADKKLFHFHVGENNRLPPGEGNIISWENVIDALNTINYSGPIVMEPFIKGGGDIAQDIMIWRNFNTENLDERIVKSRNFLLDRLR